MYTLKSGQIRSSATSIAGLFEKFPQLPEKKAPIGRFALETIFPLGHVREHVAIHSLKRCQGIKFIVGQNGYARTREYLADNMMSLYVERAWLLPDRREIFNQLFMEGLKEEVLNNPARKMAIREKSILLLLEEQVGELFLKDVSVLLLNVPSIPSAEVFKTSVILPSMVIAERHFMAPIEVDGVQQHGYYVRDIPYTLPRYPIEFGVVNIVCQPDGACMTRNSSGRWVKTVVEIKSPVYAHYTSMAVPDNPQQTAANRRALWTKYLVQIAIEMLVTGSERALFVCWFNNSAKLITLDQTIMASLMGHIPEFVTKLGEKYQAAYNPEINVKYNDALLKAFQSYFAEMNGDIIPAKKLKKAPIQTELKTLNKNIDGNLNELRPRLEAARREYQMSQQTSLFDVIVGDLNRILEIITENSTKDAWQPFEDTYPLRDGLNLILNAIDSIEAKNAEETENALFRTFVFN